MFLELSIFKIIQFSQNPEVYSQILASKYIFEVYQPECFRNNSNLSLILPFKFKSYRKKWYYLYPDTGNLKKYTGKQLFLSMAWLGWRKNAL